MRGREVREGPARSVERRDIAATLWEEESMCVEEEVEGEEEEEEGEAEESIWVEEEEESRWEERREARESRVEHLQMELFCGFDIVLLYSIIH